MTRVMRAVSAPEPAAPKVLRVGVVEAGRVVDERIVRHRGPITIGASERATFAVKSRLLEHTLFVNEGGAWSLRITSDMSGRLALASGVVDLDAVRRASAGRSGVWTIRLDESARGKLVCGGATLLFQFVTPPAPATKPQLPLSVRGGLVSSIDWTLTVIAAFSFMFHFGFIGAMYSDWLDEPVPEASVVGLLDLTKNLPPAPAPLDVVDTAPTPSSTAPAPKDTHVAASQSGTHSGHAAAQSGTQSAKMASEAEAMGLQILGALHGASAVQGALDRSNVPMTDLTKIAEADVGARPNAGTDLKLDPGGAPIGPRTSDLQHLGESTIGPTTSATAREVTGPKASGEAIPEPLIGVPVHNAEAVIASLRPSFRSCYQTKGLTVNPAMAGRFVMRIDVAPNGDVRGVSKIDGSGLSPAVEQCVMGRVQNASFDAPGGAGSKFDVPVTFVNTTK